MHNEHVHPSIEAALLLLWLCRSHVQARCQDCRHEAPSERQHLGQLSNPWTVQGLRAQVRDICRCGLFSLLDVVLQPELFELKVF